MKKAQGVASRFHLRGLSLTLALALLYSLATYLSPDLTGRFWRLSWFISGGLGLMIILAVRWARHLEWLSPSISYLMVFWLFHFGLVFPAAIASNLLFSLPPWYVNYFTKPEAGTAVSAALLFMTAFAWGFTCLPASPIKMRIPDGPKTKGLILIGSLSIISGLGFLIDFLITHGIQAFFQSYLEFFSISGSPTTSILLITCGLVFITLGGSQFRTILLVGCLTYVPVFLLLMLSGSRTGPLFTAVALLVIFNMRGMRIPKFWLITITVFILMIIATINAYRLSGLSTTVDYRERLSLQNPIKGIVELGGSICPVIATIEYMHTSPYLYGQTYVYPFYRQAARLLGQDPGSPDTDIRFIARHITGIYGAFGYSTVAEAYANGGLLAIVAFAAGWGIVLRLIHRIRAAPYGASILTVVLLPMLINVRNSFIYVPAWIFVGLLPLFGLWLFSRKKSQSRYSIQSLR